MVGKTLPLCRHLSAVGHPQDINMTDNPLGALGMRSLLRLLSRKENALKHFQSDGCCLAAVRQLVSPLYEARICKNGIFLDASFIYTPVAKE